MAHLAGEAGVFIDDLGSGGSSHGAAAGRLDRLLGALDSVNMKAGADKFDLGGGELKFLGFLLREG